MPLAAFAVIFHSGGVEMGSGKGAGTFSTWWLDLEMSRGVRPCFLFPDGLTKQKQGLTPEAAFP